MDGIRKLAAELAKAEPEEKPHKAPHTLSLRHHDYLTLQAYCKRKGIVVGDVVSHLISDLLTELIHNGELTSQDSARVDEFKAMKARRKNPA